MHYFTFMMVINVLTQKQIIKRKFERIIIDNVVDGKDEMFSKEGALIAYLFTKIVEMLQRDK